MGAATSDTVEVLRDLWSDLSREIADPDRPQALRRRAERQRAALSAVLPVLEAREAQPRVEGRLVRLSDERVAEIQEQEGAGRIDNPDYQGWEDLDSLFRDQLAARASEAALREQNATLNRNLGNLCARIHRDGGQRQGLRPTEEVVAECDAIVATAYADLAALSERVATLEKELENERRERRVIEESWRRHVCPVVSVP